MQTIFGDTPSDQTLSDLLSGDSVLWVTDAEEFDPSVVESIARLIRTPWRGVFLESSSAQLATALSDDNAEQWAGEVGFTHLISNNPTTLVLQRRARPVFFLNGRSDMSGGDSSALAGRSALLRRLNMISRLRDLEAKRIVIVGPHPEKPLEELADLWGTEFRALVTVVSEDRSRVDDVVAPLKASTDLDAIAWIVQSTTTFADAVSKRAALLVGAGKLLVNVTLQSGRRVDVDLAQAELIEHPLSDACDFIQVRDTLPVTPRDLTLEEFRAFFTRSEPTWRAFSAGLPWLPDSTAERELRDGMHRLLLDPPGTMQLFSVASEPGAGGTTQARALAFAAAKDGFPVLLVKQQSEVPSSLELTSFMFRANSVIQATHGHTTLEEEPAWLVVLDVQHFDGGTEELWRFWADLVRSGRRIAILKVVNAESTFQPPKSISYADLAYVNHDLDFDTVVHLGNHLNGFLRHFGKEKSKGEWKAFWEAHRPDIDTGIASFWIALEFWLAGYLELGESIQSWILRQFKNLNASIEVKQGLLEVAALSIERRALPERLLAPLGSPRLPWAQVLEDARHQSPGLGLAQAQSVPYGRVWAIAHDVLARYLINAVWNDRPLAGELQVDNRRDPVDLRLELISRVANRSSVGDAFARPFAVNLAVQILKLDEQFGNAEFFPHWRRVLSLLESVPSSIKNGSRTFNHHVAISRRRITQGEIFQISPEEKRDLLLRAVNEVRFALERIDATPDDEPDLNLLNTLALLYQDLATLERVAFGDKSRLAEFLAKSDEMTRRALKENPNNSYVLETAAKNLLRQDFDSDERRRVQAAAEALSYVFQASSLESAMHRRTSLGQLAVEALRVLRAPSAESAVEHLCSVGSPYGYVAKAWRSLPHDYDREEVRWEEIQPRQASSAIQILDQSPQRNWLLVRLQYDLAVVADPSNFSLQLSLLDELSDAAGYRLSLQQRLERAVLLHLQGRHKAAAEEFYSLRRDIRSSQAIIFVPERLRWLLTPDKTRRAICSARVVDSSSGRPQAQVTELAGAHVPFTPQEFGKHRMATGEGFKCQVTFSAMGAFLKPVDAAHR